MLKFNLDKLFKLRSETKKLGFLTSNGFTPAKAQRLISDKSVGLSFDNIYKLCLAFNCTPNDLFEYVPDKSNPLPPDHPLNALKHEAVPDISNILKSMSVEKLKDLSVKLNTLSSGNE
ncbi:MAG: helix-turn-helix transcriptional regulator [Bacteroidetes bacterium]|nr:helix-turn-helix transcriptional regulator [Bacteroidota bacterium]